MEGNAWPVLHNNSMVDQGPINRAPITWDARNMFFLDREKEEGIETGNPVPTRLVQRYAWWVVKLWV